MSTFHSTIQITNKTASTLTLDEGSSSGLNSSWPKTLSNLEGQNYYKFQQGFNFQLKFTARYVVDNPTLADFEYIDIYYYADGVQTFSKTLTPQPANAFPGSTIGTENKYDPVIVLQGTV